MDSSTPSIKPKNGIGFPISSPFAKCYKTLLYTLTSNNSITQAPCLVFDNNGKSCLSPPPNFIFMYGGVLCIKFNYILETIIFNIEMVNIFLED
jgi:hypothetical protein